MGRLAAAFARKSGNSYDIIREMLGRRTSATGKVINIKTAVEVATVFACVRVIGEGIAQVPLKLMRGSADGKTRLLAKGHPLYDILASRPNAWQTSFEYREMLAMHAVLCGNAFSFINRSSRGAVMELIPFDPGCVTVARADDFSLSYEVRAQNGDTQLFPAAAIWHVRGPSWNSWMGLEVMQLAREAIGLSMATEEQQARLQKNGVRPAGIYSVDGTLKADQYESLKAWIEKEMGGLENTGKPMLLDRAAKWLNTSMSGVDAQTLETRRYQVEEVCRFFRVNPIMVGAESKNTTYASAEQMFLAHVIHCLAPWYSRLEQSIEANLLTADERAAGYYPNFVEEGLLRGSAETTKDVLLGYVNGGLMTANEGRAALDMNPDGDPSSDKLRIPANITGTAPAADPQLGKIARAQDDLRAEIKSMAGLMDRPAPPINVDARTTVNPAAVTIAEGAVMVDSSLHRGIGEKVIAGALADVTAALETVAENSAELLRAGDAARHRQDDIEQATKDLIDTVKAPRVTTLQRNEKGEAVSSRSVIE